MVSPIAVTTKNEVMYLALRRDILSGEMRPGQRLVISDLAERHNVSPVPVREAIKRLQQEGLVEVAPHIGAVVTSIDFAKYEEMVEVRNQLEVMAAISAAERIPASGIRKLESVLARMEKTISSLGMRKFMDLDKRFHFAIYSHSPNTFLVENVAMLWDRCNISKYVFAWDNARAFESHKEHAEILEAIKAGKIQPVGDLIRRHKERSLERLRVALGVAK